MSLHIDAENVRFNVRTMLHLLPALNHTNEARVPGRGSLRTLPDREVLVATTYTRTQRRS